MNFLERKTIGDEGCPLIYRWTLLDAGPVKVLLHRFLPDSHDRDQHDHPRPFWTLVLRGRYDDVTPCRCMPRGVTVPRFGCEWCGGSGVEREVMRAGTLRYRGARHLHQTVTGREGAWTLVLMGPKRRAWGFWRGGRWWAEDAYREEFGHGFRCE